MSFVKIVSFVLIEKKNEEAVTMALNKAIDDLVIRRIPIFDSGLESIRVESVGNAKEILLETHDFLEED